MRFSDLSIQEKAAVIKLGIGSGLRSLLLIEDFYNSISDGGDNALSVLVNRRSSTHDDGNKRNERRMTIRDWLRGNKKDVNNTLNNMMYIDNGGKPYVNGSVASMDRLPWIPSVNTDTGQVSSRPDTYYYDNEGLLHMYPGNHIESVKRMSQGEISDFFWLMENPNNVGLNLDNGMYYRYRDPNGKDWDVGPGLVIGKAIEDKPYYTKEELDMAAYKYHMDAMDKLAPLYDEKYGSGAFGNIDDRSKLVASDVMYRVGLNGVNPLKWPNMFDAINSGNTAMMLQLSRSKFKDKNNVQNYDNARVKRLGEYLYPGEFEYIFRNSLDPNIRVRKVELKKKGGYLSSTSPEYPPIIQKVNRSKADFVQRLKDPNRAYILDWDNQDNIATHKLSWADNGVVYPLVLKVNGRLVDFSRPPYNIWAGYDNAVRNGDTIHMTPEEAEWFTTHYKDYYPGFDEYKKGGSIHIKPENRGKFTALKKRTGHSASWFKKHGTPALRKMATFALNARKWHHKHSDGGSLFDRWRQYMQNNTIDVPMTFNLPEVQVIAQAPRPGDTNYDKYIANTYDAWKRGDVDINTLPTETRNRVRGYSGTIAAQKGMDTAAKVAGITAAMPLGIIGGVTGGIQLTPYIASAAEIAGNSTLGQQIYHGLNAIAPGTAEWLLLPTWLKIGTAAADIGFTGHNVNEFRKNPNIENGIGAVLGSLPYLIPAGKEVYDLATYRKIPEYLNRIKTNQKQFSEYNIANRKVANRILPMIDDIKSRRKLATSTRKLDYIDLQLDIDGNIVKTDFAYDPSIIKINSDVPYDEWSGMHEFGHHVDYTFGLPSQDIQLLSNYSYYNRSPYVHYLNDLYPGVEQEKTELFADIFANKFSNKRPSDFNVNKNVANRILATENYDLPIWNLMSNANHGKLIDKLFPEGIRFREEFKNEFPVQIKPLAEGADIEKQLSKAGTISKNSLDAYIKKQGKFYQDVMNDVLNSEFVGTDKINYNDFKNAVSKKLPEYYRKPQEDYKAYGLDKLGIELSYEYMDPRTAIYKYNDGDLLENGLNTFTFESPDFIGNEKHYPGNPIGHSRTYITKDEPDVLHVMESLSDWALNSNNDFPSSNWYKERLDEIIKKQGYDDGNDYTEGLRKHIKTAPFEKHMVENYTSRQILENLRYAAEQGLAKMRYPTRETAAKIEGYPEINIYINENGDVVTPREATTYGNKLDKKIYGLIEERESLELKAARYDNAVVGSTTFDIVNKIYDRISNINDELFKIMETKPKLKIKKGYSVKKGYDNQFETILKKYSDFPKQYRKLFKDADIREITDSKGNTWYEVDVPENYRKGKAEILMNLAPYLGLGLSSTALNKKKSLGGPIKPFSYLPIPEVRY